MTDLKWILVEADKAYKLSCDRVEVRCDEYHSHSALNGCLVPVASRGGDERDVTICRLIELLRKYRQYLTAIVAGELP